MFFIPPLDSPIWHDLDFQFPGYYPEVTSAFEGVQQKIDSEVGLELAELLPLTVVMPQNARFKNTEAYYGCRLETLSHQRRGWIAKYAVTLFVNFYVSNPITYYHIHLNTFRMTQFDPWWNTPSYEEAKGRLIELYLGKEAPRYSTKQALACFEAAFSALEIVRHYYIPHILRQKVLDDPEVKDRITELIQVTAIKKKIARKKPLEYYLRYKYSLPQINKKS